MGAEHAAVEQGFNVLIFNARGDVEREREGVETLLTRRVDGIIFTTALSRDNVDLAIEAGVSAVEVERQLSDAASAVVVDNYSGASDAMQHLLQLGHRKIGYIGEPYTLLKRDTDDQVDRVVKDRFDAYRDALQSAGAGFDESHVVLDDYPRYVGGSGGLETGTRYMARLLEQAPDLTAVFAASDLLAAGALQMLYAREMRVPEHMSVVGFDDTFAKHLTPPLTTVMQPMFEMGVRAASAAIKLLADGAGEPTTEVCSTSLVIRGSTALPRG
jgi:LacI family transcriptional regulator